MNDWEIRSVQLRLQLGEWVVARLNLPLLTRVSSLREDGMAVDGVMPPSEPLPPTAQGYLLRNLPISAPLPKLESRSGFLCYVPLQYPHAYIDLQTSFADYQGKFSSKTRNTIARKIKKFREFSGGDIVWRTYRTPTELTEFFAVARQVSALTYQERLLNAGLPSDAGFMREASRLAGDDKVRAYILYHNERPVSYLYCPIVEGTVMYGYLGYDPDFQQWSVGTVLQWLAVEHLFDEQRFEFFDFTEGHSPHKLLFSNQQRLCANVFFLRPTLRNRAVVLLHRAFDASSTKLGAILERAGLKAKLSRLVRNLRRV